jgi:hypothetical protein
MYIYKNESAFAVVENPEFDPLENKLVERSVKLAEFVWDEALISLRLNHRSSPGRIKDKKVQQYSQPQQQNGRAEARYRK